MPVAGFEPAPSPYAGDDLPLELPGAYGAYGWIRTNYLLRMKQSHILMCFTGIKQGGKKSFFNPILNAFFKKDLLKPPFGMEHQMGLEPTTTAWKAMMLPLHYWCIKDGVYFASLYTVFH